MHTRYVRRFNQYVAGIPGWQIFSGGLFIVLADYRCSNVFAWGSNAIDADRLRTMMHTSRWRTINTRSVDVSMSMPHDICAVPVHIYIHIGAAGHLSGFQYSSNTTERRT